MYEFSHSQGQTRTSADVSDTTASPSEADMTGSPRDVAEGPTPDSCGAANKLYSITSSTRAYTVAGMSRPSDLAVLRLRTTWYFVGACTGRSAGFSPLRTRST